MTRRQLLALTGLAPLAPRTLAAAAPATYSNTLNTANLEWQIVNTTNDAASTDAAVYILDRRVDDV